MKNKTEKAKAAAELKQGLLHIVKAYEILSKNNGKTTAKSLESSFGILFRVWERLNNATKEN